MALNTPLDFYCYNTTLYYFCEESCPYFYERLFVRALAPTNLKQYKDHILANQTHNSLTSSNHANLYKNTLLLQQPYRCTQLLQFCISIFFSSFLCFSLSLSQFQIFFFPSFSFSNLSPNLEINISLALRSIPNLDTYPTISPPHHVNWVRIG